MSWPTCPCCGVAVRERCADPQIQQFSDEHANDGLVELIGIEAAIERYEGSPMYDGERATREALLKWGLECPKCHGTSFSTVAGRSLAARAGRLIGFDEFWLELAP